MRVLVAGATGAFGHHLVPQLVEAGYEVFGTTRSTQAFDKLTAAGAKPLQMDGLDRESVLAAVESAMPEVVIHQLTSLSGGIDMRHFDRDFAATNELRTKGTDNLLHASRKLGVRRFVAQSYTGWPNARTGDAPAEETEALDPDPAPQSVKTLAAIRYLEDAVTHGDLEGLALRYGGVYGPGTGVARGESGELVGLVLKRRMPIVGEGGGVWSFVHAHDAGAATVTAVGRGAPGVYNVVDDEPAPVSEWLPALAIALGAKPPRRLPAWLARPLIGEHGMNLMTKARGSSNRKAKAELGWTLRYPTWREGFRTGLGPG